MIADREGEVEAISPALTHRGDGYRSYDKSGRSAGTWLVNCAHDCTDNREFDQTACDPHAEDLCGEWLDGELNQVSANAKERKHDSKTNTAGDTAAGESAAINSNKEKGNDGLTKKKQGEANFHVRTPQARRFHISALHQHAVPEVFENEDDNERSDECENRSFHDGVCTACRYVLSI
jgi:hypothetical protein